MSEKNGTKVKQLKPDHGYNYGYEYQQRATGSNPVLTAGELREVLAQIPDDAVVRVASMNSSERNVYQPIGVFAVNLVKTADREFAAKKTGKPNTAIIHFYSEFGITINK
jgi:hypothetical protein